MRISTAGWPKTIIVPDVIPRERLYRYGARGKIRPYAGLKEEYYLVDFEPDAEILSELGLDRSRPIAVLRSAGAVRQALQLGSRTRATRPQGAGGSPNRTLAVNET